MSSLQLPLLYTTIMMTSADYYHRKAVAESGTNLTLTYEDLQKAEQLNPYVDLYRVDMSQTNFALANAIAASAKPGKNGIQLSTQARQTLAALLSQSINEGKNAVILSPLSVRDWSNLATIYQNISGVAQNALSYALSAYGQAINLNPLDPTLRLDVGGIYYEAKSYAMAIRFFTDAANLKPDYPDAYYNLALAYRDNGDTQDALLVANQAVVLLQKTPTNPEYKVAVQLLKQLSAKSSQNTGNTQPAGQSKSALKNSKLPKVSNSNLNNPPSVTPPPPVKKNPNAQLPQVTSQPSPSGSAQ
jgi:tetratricopeptide (TPR) repeat protein